MTENFIFIQNKAVNLNSIAYVEFLESGRAVIFMRGLSLEKQNIPIDAPDARRLKTFLESRAAAPAIAA
jgi:hypothetical protein